MGSKAGLAGREGSDEMSEQPTELDCAYWWNSGWSRALLKVSVDFVILPGRICKGSLEADKRLILLRQKSAAKAAKDRKEGAE